MKQRPFTWRDYPIQIDPLTKKQLDPRDHYHEFMPVGKKRPNMKQKIKCVHCGIVTLEWDAEEENE